MDMKTFEEAILKVAREYSHLVHDSTFPTLPYEKCEMIGFIFDMDPELVAKKVRTAEIKNRKEWMT
jgi:hypothetical protein